MHGLKSINRMNGMSNAERQAYNLKLDQDLQATTDAKALRKAFWITILTVLNVVITAIAVL